MRKYESDLLIGVEKQNILPQTDRPIHPSSVIFYPFLRTCYHGLRALLDTDLFVDGESLSYTLIHVVVLVGC
jgi:hypothetical protein